MTEAKEHKACLAMLYIDGDNFKNVNDQHGHDTGDDFIRKFGQVLITAVRNHDLVIRMGGDEFIVVLTGLTRDDKKRHSQMMDIIDRIRNELKKVGRLKTSFCSNSFHWNRLLSRSRSNIK